MARYNEILAGRYNRFLQKLLQMKGGPPAPQLASDFQPTINYFTGVEERYLQSIQRYGNTLTQAAVAAQNSTIQLRNPAGSNVIAVIEKVQMGSIINATMALGINAGAANLATIAPTVRSLDGRNLAAPTCIMSGGNNIAALTTAFASVAMNSGTTSDLEFIVTDDQELPLLPGDIFSVQTLQVNELLKVNLIWRERALEESELK